MEPNGGRATWKQFMQMVNTCFGAPLTHSPIMQMVNVNGVRHLALIDSGST
jgi:hypothetical protein